MYILAQSGDNSMHLPAAKTCKRFVRCGISEDEDSNAETIGLKMCKVDMIG